MVFTAEEALDEDGGAALFATVANMRDDCFCTPEAAHFETKANSSEGRFWTSCPQRKSHEDNALA
ncbi:hypothetical protein Leryth_026924 [Lithospermum erythrorhizon]|nr:hypothetical protein Leryth_026924 [Lithospermum erythrorhizon]